MDILRVISGSAKGHKLKTLKGDNTRPTTDRVKESLFNIIMPYIKDAKVLDLFSGSGSLGIEALSRGAESCIFVDRSLESIGIIKENVTHTKLVENSTILNIDFLTALGKFKLEKILFNLVFLDPPYHKGLAMNAIEYLTKYNLLENGSLVVCETSRDEEFEENYGELTLSESRIYGDTKLSFFKLEEETE